MHKFVVSLAALALAAPAFASSDDAWEEFRAEVEAACSALVEGPEDMTVEAEVNPFGSEHYGAAIVTATYPEGGQDRMICIFDKQSKAAELTAPFTPEETSDEAVKPAPDQG